MKARHPAQVASAVGWEFLQNLPLVAGFLLGLDSWQQGRPAQAVAWCAAGSVLGSWLISATESRIVKGHREPVRVLVTNMLVTLGLMLLFIAYLAAPWSRPWMDLLIGLVAGLLWGTVQDLAARTRIGPGHGLALAAGLVFGLVAVRILVDIFPVWANILIVNLAMSTLIAAIDYGPWGLKDEQRA